MVSSLILLRSLRVYIVKLYYSKYAATIHLDFKELLLNILSSIAQTFV